MMFQRKTGWQALKVAVFAGVSALISSSCVAPDTETNTTQVTPQGTVDLEKVRAGMPENVFRSARITFAVDTKPEASKGGKTQYISRTYNAKGGQYLAQCKNDKCVILEVLYPQPVAKTDGLAILPQLVPADAGEETFVDDCVMKNAKTPMACEFHYFGKKSLVLVNYTDKTGAQISSIYAYALPPEAALKTAFGKVPPALKIPESSKLALADKAADKTEQTQN